jgi:hypothetical protein
MHRAEKGALTLAALAGASAWISLGAIALINQREARLAALPPLWLLAVVVATAVAAAWLARLRTSESWPLSLTALLWMPWLPTRVPAALLIWDGPLERAVWFVAVAGVVAARLTVVHPRAAESWRHPARAPWLAAAVFFACSVAAGVHLQWLLPGGDEPHYLVITQSLLYDGDLKIENNHARGDFFEYIDKSIAPDYLRRGKDGQIYSVHAPGVAALVLPAYALAGYAGALIFVALASALGVAVLWRIVHSLTESAATAWVATLATAFSGTFFLHSFTIFPDPVGAVLVAVVLAVLVGLEAAPSTMTQRHLLLAGACLALLPWLHTRFAVVAVAFGGVFLIRLLSATQRERGRELMSFLVVPFVSALAWFLFFFVIYGTPNPAAPYGGSRQAALEWLPAGLAGLAFDQQFGLLANAPVMAAALWGFFALWRTRPRLAAELALIGVPYIAVVASFGMWWGGWSGPARFLTCLMPLTTPLLAAAWTQGSRPVRCGLAGLGVVGTMNVVARVAVENGALLYNFRDGFDLLLDWASRTVNLPLAFPSIHRLGTEPTLLLGSIWLLSGAVVLLILHVALPRRPMGSGGVWAATSWLFAVAASLAMSASWRAVRTQPLTPESSEMHFLQGWSPERRSIAVRLPAFRRVPVDAGLTEIQLRGSERARDTKDSRSLLALDRVRAGTYGLIIDGAPHLEGRLTVSVGATSQTIEEWSLQGIPSGDTGLQLRIPTRVHSVTIRVDPRAQELIAHVGLRPQHVVSGEMVSNRYALRGARYGQARAFFLDDALYMEPGGIWTRGDATAEVVVVKDDNGPVALDVTAGPVPTTVEFGARDLFERVTLAPGERRALQLPTGLWRVTTEGRFRPTEHDRGSRDGRPLGARIEFK